MSIVTKTGDHGATALLYNRRLSKSHPRIEACGEIDELNAAIGLARATVEPEVVRERLLGVQKDLVALMGELATAVEDLPRYAKDGFPAVSALMSAKLEQFITELEANNITFQGWAMPGANLCSATLDLARTVCRRAERRVCALHETGHLQNPQIIIYLNRLSDLLWLWARQFER